MTYPTEHLMDLVALAYTTTDPDELLRLLRDSHQLYHQGLAETRAAVTGQCQELPDPILLEQCRTQQLFLPVDATREDALSALSFARWENTPTALAYSSIAERAAAHGVSLLPEEGSP
ncbi:hypothetical protein DWB77_00035 [Streptomyces hundungensis]|uniref:Uncharacterized protein n=1 Tax=Streptomyces hundungensis TaxID=1077946 RepID=A0A387HBB3_9ACTN|nr:hypothetical protein [Streptomyces hundungensis]AYG77928.1 hypothetical protein DWB77_00035 [Streptomyces hundungensis]